MFSLISMQLDGTLFAPKGGSDRESCSLQCSAALTQGKSTRRTLRLP